jgi:hypothetical protein
MNGFFLTTAEAGGQIFYRLLKILQESFDHAQDERTGIDLVDVFPFMLRHSKHSERFFNSLFTHDFHPLYSEAAGGWVGEMPLSTIMHNLQFHHNLEYLNRRRVNVRHLFEGRYKIFCVMGKSTYWTCCATSI